MEYKITAITTTEIQSLIDDGTFSSCFTSALPQLKHATKPTYNWNHMSTEEKTDINMYNEILNQYKNVVNWSSYRAQKITETPAGGLERIIGLRVGYWGADQSWIADDVDQSTHYWAHIELMRNNTAGSKSWIYDADWLAIEGPFYQALGVTKWHCLMTPDTDYIDSVNTQAGLRLDADPFKTPVWFDQDLVYNQRDNATTLNDTLDEADKFDVTQFPDVDVTTTWKRLEFDI